MSHIAGEIFKQTTGTNIVHVPFKGAGQSVQALVAGQVKVSFDTTPAVLNFVRAGRLRPLAITGDQRSPVMPDVPTLKEAGVALPELAVGSWWGLLAPAGLPPAVATQIGQALNAALAAPELKARLTALNYTQAPAGTDFRRWVEREAATWSSVMDKAGIRPE
jgi:tripartite-type tricarboxylate transporter receptor subunit TctC